MSRFLVRLEFVDGSRYDGQVIEWVEDYSARQARRLRKFCESAEVVTLEAGGAEFPAMIRGVDEVDPAEVGRSHGELPEPMVLRCEEFDWRQT